MSFYFAVLKAPSDKKLIRDLAEVIGDGLAEAKRKWDSESPLLFMGTSDDEDANEHANQFEALFKWADHNGVMVTVYRSPFPIDGAEIDRSSPVDRDIFHNAVTRMKGISDEVDAEIEEETRLGS